MILHSPKCHICIIFTDQMIKLILVSIWITSNVYIIDKIWYFTSKSLSNLQSQYKLILWTNMSFLEWIDNQMYIETDRLSHFISDISQNHLALKHTCMYCLYCYFIELLCVYHCVVTLRQNQCCNDNNCECIEIQYENR